MAIKFLNNSSVTGQLTVTNGIEMTSGNFNAGDNERIRLGNSADLQIYHDGIHSHIINNTGDLTIDSQGDDLLLKAADDLLLYVQGTEVALQAIGNAGVKIRYNNVVKFETTASGVNVTGDILATGDLTVDNASGDPFVKLKTTNQEYVLRIDQSDGEKFQIRNTTDGTTDFVIDSAGNVGIGTTTPTNKLHVDGSIKWEGVSTEGVLSGSEIAVTMAAQGSVPLILLANNSESLLLDPNNLVYKLGDYTDNNNGAYLEIDDDGQLATLYNSDLDVRGGVDVEDSISAGVDLQAGSRMQIDNVKEYRENFTANGNSTLTFDVDIKNVGASGQPFEVFAGWTHYSTSFGCMFKAAYFQRSTIQSDITLVETLINQSSLNGGFWSVSYLDANTIRITKNPGSHTSPGYGYIRVTHL